MHLLLIEMLMLRAHVAGKYVCERLIFVILSLILCHDPEDVRLFSTRRTGNILHLQILFMVRCNHE